MSQIDRSWIDRAVAASERSGADAVLVLAVMVVENLQRPAWFRALEQIKGRVLKKGTYGVMQVWAAEPISDEMSIDQAAEILSAYSDLCDERGYPRPDTFRALGVSYNGSQSYGDLVFTAYQRVRTAAWVKVDSASTAEAGLSTSNDVQTTKEIDDLYRSLGKMAVTLILRYGGSVLADDVDDEPPAES